MILITVFTEVLVSAVFLIALPIFLAVAAVSAAISSVLTLSPLPLRLTILATTDGIRCLSRNASNPDSVFTPATYLLSLGATAIRCTMYSTRSVTARFARYHGIQEVYGWYATVFSYPEDSSKSGDACGSTVALYGDITRYTYCHEFVHVGQMFRYGLAGYTRRQLSRHKTGSAYHPAGYTEAEVSDAIALYTDSGVLSEIEIEAVLVGTHRQKGYNFDNKLLP